MRAIIQVVLVALLYPTQLLSTHVEQDVRAPVQSGTPSVPVVLTVSGGVSLGAYQAGVNWVLVEVFKQSLDSAARTELNIPRYEVVAVAGASAGSINGFLTAIEWCRTRDRTAPDESLFWKIWIRTGIDQLAIAEDGSASTQGLLSRQYYHDVLFDSVRTAMQGLNDVWDLMGCKVHVGLTLTRIRPDSLRVTSRLYALTQRFAAVTTVQRRNRDAVVFTQPPTALRQATTLGALVNQPYSEDGTVPVDDVFSLIEASSAFPAAFAPVLLTYSDGSGTITEEFADGGLFDNNPIDLAVGIYNEIAQDTTFDRQAQLIFLSPERLRDPYARTKSTPSDSPAGGGINALVRLAGGAIPAARQYELQVLTRQLERNPETFDRNSILTTTRAIPVLGEQLGAFAAFLGKPFRQHDFYVGIYDGLRFLAHHSCRGAQPSDSACTQVRLNALIETDRLTFDMQESRIRDVLRRLWRWEFIGEPAEQVFAHAGDTPHDVLIYSLLRANARRARAPFDNDSCRSTGRDAIEILLCLNGFQNILDDFDESAVRTAIESSIRDQAPGACAPENWVHSPLTCDVDETFRDFVRSPSYLLAKLGGRLVDQLREVEAARKYNKDEHWLGVATITEIVFHSTIGYRYRRGFDLNTSTVPAEWPHSWLAAILPNYASINLGVRGAEFGYRPTMHLSKSLALGATLVPIHFVLTAPTRWIAGPVLHWKLPHPLITGFELGPELAWRWGRTPFHDSADPIWSFPLTVYLLADKVRASLRITPWNGVDTGFNDGEKWTVGFGLSDLNGLLYRALRGFGAL